MSAIGALDTVKEYYGKILKSRSDLQSGACCAADTLPPHLSAVASMIEDEVNEKFYGCGSPIPPCLDGRTVVDLGCGSGRDAFIAAYFVGAQGHVIGLDMTDEQLEVATRNAGKQTSRFGFLRPNVEFRKGYIELLGEAGIADNSVDVVISNCVINLSPDKRAVFSEIYRVLKPGGELYFSDVFAGRRVPGAVRNDPVLYGECLGGALYIEDFRRMLSDIGIPDYRVTSKRRIALNSPELEAKAGMVDFYAMTIRAFKLRDLEDICEDYGQTATYLGTIPEQPHAFELDDHHHFIKGKPMLVCGNTAAMLQSTRYAPHFKIEGGRDVHYGPFDCASSGRGHEREDTKTGGTCC